MIRVGRNYPTGLVTRISFERQCRKTHWSRFPRTVPFRQKFPLRRELVLATDAGSIRSKRETVIPDTASDRPASGIRAITGGFPPLSHSCILILSAYAYQKALWLLRATTLVHGVFGLVRPRGRAGVFLMCSVRWPKIELSANETMCHYFD